MAEMNIDGVRANVVYKATSDINVDGVSANAVIQVVRPTQFKRTPKVELLEALSAATKVTLPVAQYEIGPVVNEDPPTAKATIDLIALESSGKRRSTPVVYKRHPVVLLSDSLDIDQFKSTTATPLNNLPAIVTKLNSLYGLTLSTYDFLPIDAIKDADTILTVAKESHYFIPGHTWNLGRLDATDREYDMLNMGLSWPGKSLSAQRAFFVKDTFRVEYNKLFGDTYTAQQTVVSDTSAVKSGPSTNREREVNLTFTVGESVVEKKIFYNRLDLAGIASQMVSTTVWDLSEGKLLTEANLAELTALMGIPFDEVELINTDVVETTPKGSINITIKAAPDSKFFKGEGTVSITRAPWVTDIVPDGSTFSL